ncbi:Ribosomal-protein-S18p-alanine acetyltransferase [Richelia intracellularis HM01]|nr:Ribosomal-protein-S18p-alanine acetyltransferase [Richelia intracellularis HM01]
MRISNLAAISLYQKFGFKIAGRRSKYYQDGEDALILWLSDIHQPEFKNNLNKWHGRICKCVNTLGD